MGPPKVYLIRYESTSVILNLFFAGGLLKSEGEKLMGRLYQERDMCQSTKSPFNAIRKPKIDTPPLYSKPYQAW